MENNNEKVIYYDSLEHNWENCKKLVDLYINYYLKRFDFKKFEIKNRSIVLLVEDSFVISFSIYKIGRNGYYRYQQVVEELMPNEIFNYVESTFRFKVVYPRSDIFGDYPLYYFYKKFTGEYEQFSYSNFVDTPKLNSMFNEVDEKIPELKLRQRYLNWEGWQYYFIMYELCYKNNKGIAVHYTQNKFPLNYAYSSEKKLEELYLPFLEDESLFNEFDKNNIYYFNKYAVSKEFVKIKDRMTDDFYCNLLQLETNAYGYTPLFNKHLYYFAIPKKIKKESDIHKLTRDLIIETRKGFYESIEKNLYTIGKYKWKSEELMVKCIKGIFKNYEVVQQYKPYFLYVNHGQMSFDAYIPKLKVAFEYQGKQHYEPVEYFGGEENFKKQQERDNIKMTLSKKNKIKLIYVNYWEDITTDLILKKLKDNNIKF